MTYGEALAEYVAANDEHARLTAALRAATERLERATRALTDIAEANAATTEDWRRSLQEARR